MKKEAVLLALRHLLTFGGGFLVAQTDMTQADINSASAALITLIGLVWSFLDKKQRRKTEVTPDA